MPPTPIDWTRFEPAAALDYYCAVDAPVLPRDVRRIAAWGDGGDLALPNNLTAWPGDISVDPPPTRRAGARSGDDLDECRLRVVERPSSPVRGYAGPEVDGWTLQLANRGAVSDPEYASSDDGDELDEPTLAATLTNRVREWDEHDRAVRTATLDAWMAAKREQHARAVKAARSAPASPARRAPLKRPPIPPRSPVLGLPDTPPASPRKAAKPAQSVPATPVSKAARPPAKTPERVTAAATAYQAWSARKSASLDAAAKAESAVAAAATQSKAARRASSAAAYTQWLAAHPPPTAADTKSASRPKLHTFKVPPPGTPETASDAVTFAALFPSTPSPRRSRNSAQAAPPPPPLLSPPGMFAEYARAQERHPGFLRKYPSQVARAGADVGVVWTDPAVAARREAKRGAKWDRMHGEAGCYNK
ncbi:hypothetical protein H9P43_000145 [Blastocladiella emersonii ATCC 22665]|nr:hypothetical protein H9P43_000145 [Blastocladiella emersonii ATCC 22665]